MKSRQLKLLNFWPLFFLLASMEAAVALLIFARIPFEGGSFSLTRWVLIFPLGGAVIAFTSAAYFAWRDLDFSKRWLNPVSKPVLYSFLTIASPLLAIGTSIGAFFLRWWDPDRLYPFFVRTWPLMAFVIIFSFQTTVWLLVLRFGIHKTSFEARKPSIIAFIILLLLFGFVVLTRLGVTPDPAYWGEPGVALQGWQLGLALMMSVLFLPISLKPSSKPNSRRVDFLIAIFIWLLAAGIWLSVPNDILKNSFYFPIDPPANMPLPYSDSAYYDYMAHSLLIGTDYLSEIPTRPLYILFLTFLHLLFGENYNALIYAQTVVLSAYPVAIYMIGKMVHSRLAGLTIALLAIFREWTNLLVSSDTRVSNTKTLLVDTPTLLLILLACLFAFRWLERKDKRSAFIAGGIFGILLLLRTQSLLILPLLLLVAFLAMRSEKLPWVGLIMVFTLGVTVSTAPWLGHNYLSTGKITFDAPFQYQVLASQYAYTGNLDFSAVDLENKSLRQILVTFALNDPGFVVGFISNHLLATEIGALLALPLIAPFEGLREPINLYWTTFDGTLALSNYLLLIIYLAIIAIGLGAAWKRWRWLGYLPLAFNLGYAAANGIARFSGWRYDLPADWIAYFYFGIGFVEMLFWSARLFGARIVDIGHTEHSNPSAQKISPFFQLLTVGIAFMLAGSLPWIAKNANPPSRYPALDPTTLLAQIAELHNSVSREEISTFGSQLNAITIQGRLLYPRTFSANTGLTSATPWPSYAPRDYPRLGFKLLNQDVLEVVFPNKGVPVKNVHGQDVIVLGCQRENYVEARLLVFHEIQLSYLSNLALEPCLP